MSPSLNCDDRRPLRQALKPQKKSGGKPTRAEGALWGLQRDRRFNGFKFQWRAPLGDYIANFVCFERRLIVEAEGSQHGDSVSDPVRDACFASQGFRVRRFCNGDILRRREEVMDTLWPDLAGTPSSGLRPPSPTRGEGPPGKETERGNTP